MSAISMLQPLDYTEMKPSNTENIAVYREPDPILQAFTGKEIL